MTVAAPAPAAPAASPAPAVVPPAAVIPDPSVTPAPAAVKPATVLDPSVESKPGDPPAAAGTYPDDWRERAAKTKEGTVDDKRLARLKRYTSPEAAMEALIHAQDRIAKGDLQKVLGENPTAEEVAEYRLANGIPAKPEEYKVELGNGRVIGEADKPLVDKFLAAMHAQHASPKYVNATLNAYYDLQDEQIRAREDADVEAKTAIEDTLRQEWGGEYRGNVNAVRGLLGQFGESGSKLLTARLADGTLLFNEPGVLKAFVQIARDLNPAATVAPGSAGGAEKTLADELNALKADLADPDSDYHKGPQVLKNGVKQTVKAHRYFELVEAQERLAGRRAA